MVYLIDTYTNELRLTKWGDEIIPVIRRNQKMIEKNHAVMTVTDRDVITYYVCDYIPMKKFRPKINDIVLRGNILYDESILHCISK
jgi:hypothetical protein